MAYIDPVTGAYVENGLDALPPGYNQPKPTDAANIAKMRALLNSEEALRQQQINSQAKDRYLSSPAGLVKYAYEHMPGAPIAQAALASASDMFGQLLGVPYGIGKEIANKRLTGSPEGTAYAYDQSQKLADKLRYTPPTQAGRDIYEGVNKLPQVVTGSHMGVGPLPELWTPSQNRRFTPDDLRVAGKTAIEDVRNFSNDYANARAGLTRDYPTAGSTVANIVQKSEPVVEHVVKPLAEKAYDRYINPWDHSESSASPIANISGLFDAGSPMFAVKPKGGNWPTNLGSTLPLSEQGALGEHLSKAQYADPMAVFDAQLKKHYARGIDNRQLIADFEDYQLKRLGLALDPNSPERFLSNEQLRKKIADEFAEGYNAGTIGSADIEHTDKKLHTASQIEQALPHYNAWVMGPYQKYITNQMGTGLATDPLLQAVNEGGMPPHEIFGQDMPKDFQIDSLQRNADYRRNDFLSSIFGYGDKPEKQTAPFGKTTATTPEGILYENALDASLYAKGPYSFKDENGSSTTKFPVVGKLDRNTLISDFLTSPEERTGFGPIRKQVFQDLLAGNLDPAKMSNVTPATVTRQMIKDKMAEFKEAQLSKKGAAEWIPKRAAEMPTDMEFSDGSKMTIITPEMANADELMTARDLGQITIDLNQCVGAGCHGTQDYPGHGPYVVPHTGKPPRGKVEYDKYGYMRRLKNSEIEIASLKNPEGVSEVTIELKLDKPQTASEYTKLHRAVKEWLKENAPDRLDQYLFDFSGDGITPRVLEKLSDIPGFNQFLLKEQSPTKAIHQIKGHSNNEIKEEYVPQTVEWLNANADNLTDVRDLNNLPGVSDLTRTYDTVGKLMDQHQHWYSPTVEDFLDKVTNEKLLPRFFTDDDFALKATEMGVDLSAEPKNDVVNDGVLTDQEVAKRQKYYETVSQELRNTFTGEYLQDAFNGDRNALQAILRELDDRPTGYFLGTPSPGIRQHVINRLRNEGLHNPEEENLANAIQQMEPEPIDAEGQRIEPFDRPEFPDALAQNMNDYFEGNAHNLPEDMIEPYATDMRILMGSQTPEYRLPIGVHRRLVEGLINQDQHTADLRDLMNRFQQNNHFLTEAQAENLLNILISWTERYPLNE